jgi:hypothetical protein
VLRIQYRQLVIEQNSGFAIAGGASTIEEHIIALEAWHIRYSVLCHEQTYIPGALPQTWDCGTTAGASRHPWPEVDEIAMHTAPEKTALGTSRK